jgi:hypothetical protein
MDPSGTQDNDVMNKENNTEYNIRTSGLLDIQKIKYYLLMLRLVTSIRFGFN